MSEDAPDVTVTGIRSVIDHLMNAAAAHGCGNNKACRSSLKEADIALALTRAGYDRHYPLNLKKQQRSARA